jgi:hypothetical protein
MVVCPMSGEIAAVRKDKRGAFYLIGVAGRLAPSTDFGQDWFLEHATIWGEGEPPAECPDWIRQGKSFPPLTRSRTRRPGSKPAAAAPGAATAGEESGAGAPTTPGRAPAHPEPVRERNPFLMFGADDDA